MKIFKDMKRWKTIIQFIITVLTAIISSFFVQSCATELSRDSPHPLSRGKIRIHWLPLLHHPQRHDLSDAP